MIKILEAHDFSYEKIYPGCCFLNFSSICFMQISPHLPRTVPEKEKSDLIYLINNINDHDLALANSKKNFVLQVISN